MDEKKMCEVCLKEDDTVEVSSGLRLCCNCYMLSCDEDGKYIKLENFIHTWDDSAS